MKVFLKDKFLTKKECKELIKFYETKPTCEKFNTTFPMPLIVGSLPKLEKKINEIGMYINGSIIDWFQIVKWPSPNLGKELHKDTASNKTTLSSIIYLNDNYIGGHTFFEDGTSFAPVTGRAIFFDGNYYKHGVYSSNKNDRYTVATWMKENEF
tara:strand:+ start:1705 stop:2166 length:462 start_codon:yes stop_codon:yes gene_type:complete